MTDAASHRCCFLPKVSKQTGQTKLNAYPARRASLVHCCCLMWSAVFPILCAAHSITGLLVSQANRHGELKTSPRNESYVLKMVITNTVITNTVCKNCS